MIKKIFSIILTVAMVLSLSGFSNSYAVEIKNGSPNISSMGSFAKTKSETEMLFEVEKLVKEGLLAGKKEIDISNLKIKQSEMPGISNLQFFSPYFGNGISCVVYYSEGGNYAYVAIQTDLTTAQIKDYFNRVDVRLQEITSLVDSSMNKETKALVIHDYLCMNGEYDYERYKNGTVPLVSYSSAGIIMENIGVCNAYAYAYMYVMNLLGIECYVTTSASMNHAWNIINIDGSYYHVDCTWDDPVPDTFGLVRHLNFLVSDTGIADSNRNHKGWDTSIKCTNTKYDDYYWKNVNTQLCVNGNDIYYIQDSALIKRSGNTSTNLNIPFGRWYTMEDSFSYWPGCYSGLFLKNNELYYNTSTQIMKVSLDGSNPTVVAIPDTSEGYIYGIRLKNNKIQYLLKTSPNVTSGTIKECDITFKSEVTSLILDKTSLSLNIKDTAQLSALVVPEDAFDKTLTWSSSDMSVASVDDNGKVTAMGAGTTIITVSSINGKIATCEVTVKSPITGVTLDTASKTINKGSSFTLTATIVPSDTTDDKTLTWSSSNTSVASVDNNGKVTAIGTGTATITVKTSNGKTATCEVTVKYPITNVTLNVTSKTVTIGDSFTLKATINPNDTTDSKTLTWKSDNENVATVDKDGEVTAKGVGTATIIVTTSNGKTATCTVTVNKHVHSWDNGTVTKKPTCEDTGLKVIKCTTCKETKNEVIPALGHKWNKDYTVDKKATTESEGQKSIHCSVCDAIKKDSIVVIPKIVNIPITSVKLNKSSVTVKKGKTYTLIATINPSDTTDSKSLKWTSSNPKVAKVNSKGVVTAVSYGKATITVTTSNGKTAKCTVTVPYTITYKLNGGKNNKSNPSTYYGKKIILKNPTRKGYTFSGWYSDKKYKKRVKSFSSGNKTLYAKWTKVKVSKAKTPKLTNVKGKKLKITYSATSGAKGYQIQYSTSKKFTKATTKTVKGKSATYTLAKKTYYVRVRAYKTDSTGAKVYGSWSTVKSIKIKK